MSADNPQALPRAEAVLASYGRLEVLEATLGALRRLYPELPVCVGLQGKDAFGAEAERLAKRFSLRLERFQEPSIPRTLNRCIAGSSAEVVLLLDDDALPCPGWLEAHLAAFAADPGLVYTCGREVRLFRARPLPSDLARIAIEALHRPFLPRDAVLFGRIVGWLTATGLLFGNFDRPGQARINAPRACNLALRRAAFLQAGGFCEDFSGNAWGFEVEFGQRLARGGHFGRYLGEAPVLHAEAPTGGSRARRGRPWFTDFLTNHKVLMRTLGPLGWLGSTPRLLARWLHR